MDKCRQARGNGLNLVVVALSTHSLDETIIVRGLLIVVLIIIRIEKKKGKPGLNHSTTH
jgi:hypothetical protein